MEEENEKLKERIDRLEFARMNGDEEKVKYMEGAVWMGKKLTGEIERLCASLEELIQEHERRAEEMQGTQMTNFGVIS